ncbi:Uncharacterised protein [Mycobacteroides abscessus subsp. abscessus]|nr:Uncharacterised protein [Mycobacteroides abscessus subsp. abscessus]
MAQGIIRPLRASARRPEHSAGHDDTPWRAIQSISDDGSHGCRCDWSASRARLHAIPSRNRMGRTDTTPAGTLSFPSSIGHPGCALS